MTTMTKVFKQRMSEQNLSGMVAGTWGFLWGTAVTVTLTATLLYWLGVDSLLVRIVASILAALTLTGSAFLLFLEWVNPSITSPGDFARIVWFAFKSTFWMPLLVATALVLLLTWRWLLRVAVLFLLARMKRQEMNLRGLATGAP